jgi:hypothetical protein
LEETHRWLSRALVKAPRVTLRFEGIAPALIQIANAPARLGRDKDADVVFRDPGISRRHAELKWSNQQFVIEDAGSRAGTWVAGARLATPVHLSGQGTEFQFGPHAKVHMCASSGPQSASYVTLTGLAGIDRSLKAFVCVDAFELEHIDAQLWGLTLVFHDHGVQLSVRHDSRSKAYDATPARLNRERLPHLTDLCDGDRVDVQQPNAPAILMTVHHGR